MKFDAGVINFAVYENATEYLGVASITFPESAHKTLALNGAGIAGDVNLPVPGHKDAATVTINFRDITNSTYKLAEFRRHILDCRVAHESYDNTAGQLKTVAHKYILEVLPLTTTRGDASPANAQAASGTYSLLSMKEYIDGKLVSEFDPLNFKDVDSSGFDSLASVRSALGK